MGREAQKGYNRKIRAPELELRCSNAENLAPVEFTGPNSSHIPFLLLELVF